MKRVMVIGSGGSGKTMFSRELSKITGLPAIHLDKYHHMKKYNYSTDEKAWLKRVTDLAAGEEWIMDGNYKSSMDIRLRRADVVIFLDYPVWVRLPRIYKRRLQYRNKKRPEMPDGWEERIKAKFFWYVVNYRRKTRPGLQQLLKHYPDLKILTFTSSRQTREYLNSL